jgi:hypothetical protein
MGPVSKNNRNQDTFLLVEERSLHAQQIPMPTNMKSTHGIPKPISTPNKITDGILADEEFKNCTTPGIASTNVTAKRHESSTAEKWNTAESTLDSSHLNFICCPAPYCVISRDTN